MGSTRTTLVPAGHQVPITHPIRPFPSPPKAGLGFDAWLRRLLTSELAVPFSCHSFNLSKAPGLVAVERNVTRGSEDNLL